MPLPVSQPHTAPPISYQLTSPRGGNAVRFPKTRNAKPRQLAWDRQALAGPETLRLHSPGVLPEQAIPLPYAARRVGGQNISPALAWTGIPAGAASPGYPRRRPGRSPASCGARPAGWRRPPCQRTQQVRAPDRPHHLVRAGFATVTLKPGPRWPPPYQKACYASRSNPARTAAWLRSRSLVAVSSVTGLPAASARSRVSASRGPGCSSSAV
jgi:hypothetical protein